MPDRINIIGGGLAGCEAALMAARLGVKSTLWEMKPAQFSPAHSSPRLGELVCSNSLRSDDPTSAVGLLKLEMALLGSGVMAAARATAVGAGKALAVDRERFAAHLEGQVTAQPRISLERGRMDKVPEQGLCILASGPLTAGELAADLARLTGAEGLHFYDAIAPIVTLESVDMGRAFWADRYGEGPGDYLNCPLTKPEYEAFYEALTTAEQVPLKDFEEPKFFEGCLPIEVMAARGPKTLLFGPMKPVGLSDPHTGQRPFAVVQLRKETAAGRTLNLVGFQTKLTYPAQRRVFAMIPALASAEFARLGSIHRNTFIEAPKLLSPGLYLKAAPWVYVAGQLSGVEGYVESAASGMLSGLYAARRYLGMETPPPPAATALGALLGHLGNQETKRFQPANINFGLFPPLEGGKIPKKQRGQAHARRALKQFLAWLDALGLEPAFDPPEI